MMNREDVRAAFASFVEARPEARATLDDLWRHVLTHFIEKPMAAADDELSATKTIETPKKPPDFMEYLLEYSRRPRPTREDMAAYARAHWELSLAEFDGF